MQKLPLRPLRLTHVKNHSVDGHPSTTKTGAERVDGEEEGRTNTYSKDARWLGNTEPMPTVSEAATPLQGEIEAQHLLKRTPNSYLLNQAYGLWLIGSLFLLSVLVTHNVSTQQYGVFAAIQTAINTILYIVALGLEDATATFVPRVFAEYGRAAAAALIRRLLGLRILMLLISAGIIIFSLPLLARWIVLIPLPGAKNLAASLNDPVLLGHVIPIALYVVGTGITNLFMATCAALMRMQRVFIIGSLIQLGVLTGAFVALRQGWAVDGVLWSQAIVALLGALGFVSWFAPLLLTQGTTYRQPLKPLLRLGISAWQTNLVSGALLKQVAIILLTIYVARAADTAIAYFNLSFQIADATNILLVAGFAGVGGSALAAAFIGNNYERLARSWQALIKVETLLAAPGLIFCLFNASTIARLLFSSKFDAVGPLLAIFLVFNILVRVIGTTIHQSSLYVIGQARWVVLSQWVGLSIVIGLGIALIPSMGPAGALVADGLAKTVTGTLMLLFLLRKLPRRYPLELLGFTVRFLLALAVAALPSLLWHPSDRFLLGVSGVMFLVLCCGLLLLIKPLNGTDMEMLAGMNPKIARYLRWFARGEKVKTDRVAEINKKK